MRLVLVAIERQLLALNFLQRISQLLFIYPIGVSAKCRVVEVSRPVLGKRNVSAAVQVTLQRWQTPD
jgi:hypothetical protein